MHLLHGLDYRQEDVPGVLPGKGAGFLKPLLQRLAFDEIHDDVGGLVGQEQIQNLNHLGNFSDPGHLPGFLQEDILAAVPGRLGLLGAVPLQGGSVLPHHLTRGVVFLDGYLLLQHQIPADVGQAEAALTQKLAHQVFPVQNRPRCQGVARCFSRLISAVGAWIGRDFLHAAIAAIDLHIWSSFLFSL